MLHFSEAKINQWDPFDKDVEALTQHTTFREVPLERFQVMTGITHLSFHDDDESIEDDLAMGNDIKTSLATFKGHVIGKVSHNGVPFYMTPMGLSPDRLPALSASPKLIDQYISRSTFEITADNLPGSFVAHGTSARHAKSLETKGLSHEHTIKGYMGKGLYAAPNGEYALSYAVDDDIPDDLTQNDDACAVILQIHPSARVMVDSDPRFGDIQNEWSRDDFHRRAVNQHGVDIMVVPAFDAICIYNPEAVEVIGSVTKAEMKAYQHEQKKESDLSP